MLSYLTDLFLTGVVFNRISQDAGLFMLNTEQFVDYIYSYIVTREN